MRGPEMDELIRLLLEDARAERATDVHLHSTPTGLRLRYRVDGRMRTVRELPPTLAVALPQALSALSGVGGGWLEGVLPANTRPTVRVSTMQSVLGPNVVLRLVEGRPVPRALGDLAMGEGLLARWREVLASAWGLVVITGPTGSGKTTTAYASLAEMGGPECNTVMVEDPVELLFDWAVQIPVREDLPFPAALRGVLFQDPDVVYCSEVRDAETAELLCQMALSGHVALTCMHAPDACGAMHRLMGVGLPASMVASAVRAVLAQRLLRKVCPDCAVRRPPTAEEASWLQEEGMEVPAEVAGAAGCTACAGTGYRGRTAVYHLVVPPEGLIRTLYGVEAREAGPEDLRAEAAAAGLGSLRAEAFRLAAAGVTTVEEAEWATRVEA